MNTQPSKSKSKTRSKSKTKSKSRSKSRSKSPDSPKDIAALNNLLQRKCPDLELHLGLLKELPGKVHVFNARLKNSTVLCLYKSGECISSITLKQSGPTVFELLSATDAAYQNKKYNTMLRMAASVLCRQLNPTVNELQSDAVSPISAYLMMKYFDIVPDLDPEINADFSYFVNTELPKLDTATEYPLEYPKHAKEIVAAFYAAYPNDVPIVFRVPISPQSEKKALQQFRQLVGDMATDDSRQIICP
jgi:hypothetical protein